MKSLEKPFVSVITATWNREQYIMKLANSLLLQTYKNFEWIVGNDGSKDETDKFIREFANKANFKIKYFCSSHRIGKSKMDNLLYEKVSGKYVTSCGSDDILLPDALEHMVELIKEIPKKNENTYAGALTLATDNNNVNQSLDINILQNNINTLSFEKLKEYNLGDATTLELYKHIKGKKFLEVDFLIHESSFFDQIFENKKYIVSKKITKIMDRTAKNSISFGKKIEYCRGSAYSLSLTETKENFNKKKILSKLKTVINYWRFTIHGEIIFKKAKNMFFPTKDSFFYTSLYLISFLICVRDYIFKDVNKTHLEFNKNIKQTKIEFLNLN